MPGRLKKPVEYIPIDRILLETDCPYLARSRTGKKKFFPEPSLCYAKQIAQLKGMTAEEVLEITDLNARKFYGIN